MGYTNRGDLPGSKTDKLTYELVRSHINNLHRTICALATCESLLRNARHAGDGTDKEHRVEIWVGAIVEKLEEILPDLSGDTSALDAALERLVMPTEGGDDA